MTHSRGPFTTLVSRDGKYVPVWLPSAPADTKSWGIWDIGYVDFLRGEAAPPLFYPREFVTKCVAWEGGWGAAYNATYQSAHNAGDPAACVALVAFLRAKMAAVGAAYDAANV